MIREVCEKDYETIYQLGSILHPNFRNVYNFDELITKDYFHILVYEKNKKVIGFLMYTILDKVVDILDIVVDPKYRRQKVASNLMDRMISSITIDDVIYLEVAVDNQSAISLYEKFGFEIIHTRKNYYQEKDAYVMERRVTLE